jgi:hypothetical protein
MPAWLGLVPSSLGREVGTRQTLRRGACGLLASVRLCERKVSRAIVAIYIDAGRYRSKRGETTYGSAPPLGFVRSVFWRSWARVIRGRLPVIGRPNADILHHAGVAAGAPRRSPGVTNPASTCAEHARRQACGGARRAGGYRLSRPCSG